MIPEVPKTGRLRDVRLPHILIFLQRHKKTGALTIRRNDQEKTIYLKDGDMIFAVSQYPDERLGEILLKAGKITFSQYERSAELVLQTGKRQGTILVEQGYLTPENLLWGVTYQVREIILSLFTWIDGEYRFEEGPLPTEEVITLRMSTGNLILEGIKRINDWTRLLLEIPPVGSKLRFTSDPLILFQDVHLMEKERKILSHIDGSHTIREIFSSSELSAFETLKILHFLYSIRVAEVMEIANESARAQGVAETPVAEAEEIFKKVDEETQQSRQKILAAFEAAKTQDRYEVLGVNRDAAYDEIKRAYFKLAKDYHPDRHFNSAMKDLKEELEILFHRITQAYDTLLTEDKRREYDFKIAAQKVGAREVAEAAGITTSPEGRARLGQAALKKGDLKTAAFYFELAIRAAPSKGSYHALLAQALSQIRGRVRDAELHYKRAIELDPSQADHYIGLGLLYKKGGMFDRALKQFEEALVWDPNNRRAKEEIKDLKTSRPR